MAVFSSWRNEIELSEVLTDNLNSKKDKKITGEGVNNKKLIKVFPDDSSDVKEQTTVDGSPVTPDDKQTDRKEKQLKKRLLRLKLTGIAQGHGADITTSYEPEGEMVEGVAKEIEKGVKRHKKAVEAKKVKERKAVPYAALAAEHQPEGDLVDEAKVDAGKSPEEKEKDRNVRKFGVSHNVVGHGKLRRALHRSDRGDKKIKGDKTQWVETEEVALEEVGISSSAAMEKARKEAELQRKEAQAVKKEKKSLNKEEIQMATEAKKKQPSVHDDYYDPMEDPYFDPHEAEATRGQSGRGTKGKMNVRKKYPVKEEYELTEELINDSIEDAINYFSKQGINEEGLDLVIEEVGIDDFVEFVLDPSEDLMEEVRKARKAKVSAKSYAQVKSEVDASDAAKKAAGKGEYAKSYAKRSGETEDSTNYDDKPAKKKAAPKKPVVKKVTVKKAAPAKKAETKKKVVAATQTAKKKQPLKPISKPGLGSKIRSAVSKGVERHKAAVGKAKTEVGKVVKTAKTTAKQHSKHRKDFVSGISPTAREKKIAKGVGGAVKKALTREELELLEKWESAAEANRKYDRARKAAARRAAERNRQRDAGERNDGRRERESYRSASGQQMHYKGYKVKEEVVGESRLDKDPPSQFEKGDDDRGNPDYMKSVSYADEKKWERLQRMRKASKKKVSKEEKNWIQKAVKRPGAFTAKANKHDMSVQGFAKYVDDNPKKFDTRTKRQANLAQTFASMKKEDMDEMIEILGEVLLEG
jgi:hypothetical protein